MNVIINIFIYLFQLAGAYFVSGNSVHVVHGDNVTVIRTCAADGNNKCVTWTKCVIKIASIKNECELANGADPSYR
jgi:hypothetical protein